MDGTKNHQANQRLIFMCGIANYPALPDVSDAFTGVRHPISNSNRLIANGSIMSK
jgi:hypothetical protein